MFHKNRPKDKMDELHENQPVSFYPKHCHRLQLPSQFGQFIIVDSFKTALHHLSGVTNSHHQAMTLQQ